jgi:hypothetical protein
MINAKKIGKISNTNSSVLDKNLISLDKSEIIKKEKKIYKKTNEEQAEKQKLENITNHDDSYLKNQKEGYKESKKNKMSEQEKKSSYYLIGAFIIIILVSIGFFLIPKFFNQDQNNLIQENYTYNHFKFEKRYDTWFTEFQEGNNLLEIALIYGPKELVNVTVEGNIYSIRQINEAYLTFDPTEKMFSDVTMANAEVSTKLAMHFGVKTLPACTKDTEVCKTAGVEIVSCEANKTMAPGKGIIFLNQAPGPKVIIDGNCAIIQGEGADIIKAADRFMLGYYGIMK